MTIRQFLNQLRFRLVDQFRDLDRQISRADVGVLYTIFCLFSQEQIGAMKNRPYEAENPKECHAPD